jgi:hypothetical protein
MPTPTAPRAGRAGRWAGVGGWRGGRKGGWKRGKKGGWNVENIGVFAENEAEKGGWKNEKGAGPLKGTPTKKAVLWWLFVGVVTYYENFQPPNPAPF